MTKTSRKPTVDRAYPRDSTRGYRAKSATRARKAARVAKRATQGRA